jgi:hypothetical protein
MDAFLNIAGFFFMLSGVVAWVAVAFVGFFYWTCNRPSQEE